MDGKYIARPLAKTIRSAKSKVIILEGARAVGKTMMMRREFTSLGYQYSRLQTGTHFASLPKILSRGFPICPYPPSSMRRKGFPDCRLR